MATGQYTQQRRSSRIQYRCPVKITGLDGAGKRFIDECETVTISKYGAAVKTSRTYTMGQTLTVQTLEHGHSGHFQVVWLRPATGREPAQIGIEWVTARRFWGIEFPPEDWANN